MIKIFIGTSETEDRFAERILTWSLYKNATQPLDIKFLRPSMFPEWNQRGWGTPFTCFRYAIPELCNFEGRAIYMDVDQINFRDITHLWKTDLEGNAFGMVWDTLNWNDKEWNGTEWERGWYSDSVMLIDCEKAKPHMAPIAELAESSFSYKYEFMRKMGCPKSPHNITKLDSRWNSFDGYVTDDDSLHEHRSNHKQYAIDEIWQLHWTGLSGQPWHPKYGGFGKATHSRQDLTDLLWEYADIVDRISEPWKY